MRNSHVMQVQLSIKETYHLFLEIVEMDVGPPHIHMNGIIRFNTSSRIRRKVA